MTSETDQQFMDRVDLDLDLNNTADIQRLLALARRGAAAERLRIENIQMQAALGYAICAEDERHIIPSNPYKCGVCDANKRVHAEIERLRAALREIAKHSRGGVIDTTEKMDRDEFIGIARAALEERT